MVVGSPALSLFATSFAPPSSAFYLSKMSLKQNLLLSEDDAYNLKPTFLPVTQASQIWGGKQRVVCFVHEADLIGQKGL